MLSTETLKLLSDMKATPYGGALQLYLDEEFEKINDIQTCTTLEEMLDRKHALATLERLFSFMAQRKDTGNNKPNYE